MTSAAPAPGPQSPLRAPPSSTEPRAHARRAKRLGAGRPWPERLHDLVGDPLRTARFVREQRRFRPRADDVFVATYPRSGTTWLTYLCWCLVQPTAPPPNKASSKSAERDPLAPPFAHLGHAVPWFERALARGHLRAADLEQRAGPRVFKSHLLPRWLPAQGRVIVGVRDVADVAVSYWRLYQSHLGYRGSLEAFAQRMAAGRVQYGAWSTHVGAWSRAASHPGVLVVRYEDLRSAPGEALDRIAAHLNVRLPEARRAQILQQTSRAVMKRYEAHFDHATSPGHDRPHAERAQFIGAGRVGHGSEVLPADLVERLRSGAPTPHHPGLSTFLR